MFQLRQFQQSLLPKTTLATVDFLFSLGQIEITKKILLHFFNGICFRFPSYLELHVPPHDCPLLLCPPLLPRHPPGGVQPIEGRGGQDLTGEVS